MKFIHAADLHIDSPLRGLSHYEGAPVGDLRSASRRAFTRLVDVALDEEVGLVVLAGDVFDGDWPDYNTGLFFCGELSRLTREGIAVVLVAGNHDADSRMSRALSYPQGVVLLAAEACQTLRPDDLDLPVAVHGQSYAAQATVHNLTENYPPATPGVFNIGVLHTALDGRDGHSPYAPCTLDDLRAKGYEYWALGHVHRREVVCDDPWVVFPGNLQGRHARETGPKGFTVVEVEDDQVVSVEHRDADVVRWVRCEVDATDRTSLDDIADLVAEHLDEAVDQADGRLVAARVEVTGNTEAHDGLHADHERFRTEVRRRANESGEVWVEKIVLSTRRAMDLAALADRDDAVGHLFAGLRSLRGDPDELVRRFAGDLRDLRAKMPREVRDEVDPDDPEVLVRALEAAEAHLSALVHEELSA